LRGERGCETSARGVTVVAFGYQPTSVTFRCREASAFAASASTSEANTMIRA